MVNPGAFTLSPNISRKIFYMSQAAMAFKFWSNALPLMPFLEVKLIKNWTMITSNQITSRIDSKTMNLYMPTTGMAPQQHLIFDSYLFALAINSGDFCSPGPLAIFVI